MLEILRPERYLILAVLILGIVFTAASYYQKIGLPAKSTTINIDQHPALIDINSASMAQLQGLPGIGPVLAKRIIIYREKQGAFRYKEELKNVKGIGDRKFGRIEDLIVISE